MNNIDTIVKDIKKFCSEHGIEFKGVVKDKKSDKNYSIIVR
ncbi:hypothetical protein [Clostridium baratii]|nr:hypothetical protein [Clostridium baratii]